MNNIAVILCLSILSTASLASWVKIDTKQESQVFLNRDQIKRDYPHKHGVQVWLKFVTGLDLTSDNKLTQDYKLIRYEADCNKKTRGISAIYIYKEGKIVSSEEFTKLSYKPVVPDSTGEYNLNQVCDYVYPK